MRRSIPAFLVVVLSVGACAIETSSTTSSDAPLPTIGLGSDIGEADPVGGGEDVQVVGTNEIDTVIMVGDSITVASTPQLETMFEQLGFDSVAIESKQGKRIALSFGSNLSGVEVAEDLIKTMHAAGETSGEGRAENPFDHSNELWVVALGTNDIGQYSGPGEIASAVDEMLQVVPDESPLVWVDTFFRDRPDDTVELNVIIRDLVSQRDLSVIASWSAVADDDGNLRTDGVHPREQGSIVFANVTGNAIADFLQLT